MSKKKGKTIIPPVSGTKVPRFSGPSTFARLPEIRDVESCYLSSSLAVDLAKKYDSDLHVFHLTTEKEMDLFSSGAIDGKKITSEVCVHHMFFNETSSIGNRKPGRINYVNLAGKFALIFVKC